MIGVDLWRQAVERELGNRELDRVLVLELPGALKVPSLPDPVAQPRRVADTRTRHALVAVQGRATRRLADECIWMIDRSLDKPPGDRSDAAVQEWRLGSAVHIRWCGNEVAHALDVHESGASIPLEVAVAVARYLDALRSGRDSTPLGVAVGPEVFLEVAKLRALRSLARRAAKALTGRNVELRIVSRTSLRSFSRIEEETNAIRATLGTLAAIIGGSDVHATAPFDILAGSASPSQTSEKADRLAATTGLIAALEAYADAPADPTYGSHFVEFMTREIQDLAWEIVRDSERQGGARAAEAPWRARIAEEARARSEAAARGSVARVGASRFARYDAPLAPPVDELFAHILREASPFEELRERAVARSTRVLSVGDARALAARESFVAEILGCFGARVERSHVRSMSEACERAHGVAEDAVALCVLDADFGDLAPLVSRLANGRAVLVAGHPGTHETALRDAGARAFLYVGSDLPAVARAFYGSTPSSRRADDAEPRP